MEKIHATQLERPEKEVGQKISTPKISQNPQDLPKNYRVLDIDFNSLNCKDCNKSFQTRASTYVHFRYSHATNSRKIQDLDSATFACPHCDARFVKEPQLYDHLEEVHKIKDERGYQCHFCPKVR